MSGAQKSESPLAGGQIAKENTKESIILHENLEFDKALAELCEVSSLQDPGSDINPNIDARVIYTNAELGQCSVFTHQGLTPPVLKIGGKQ